MEREVPLFCGEAVVSHRVANVAELNAKRVPPFCFALFRFAFRCFVLLRVASLCFVLLRAAPLCFALLPRSGLGSFWVFDLFYLILLRFALLRFVLLRFAGFFLVLLRFAS